MERIFAILNQWRQKWSPPKIIEPLTSKWRQKCSLLQIIKPLTAKTWGQGCVKFGERKNKERNGETPLRTSKHFEWIISNNYSMSPSGIWSDKLTNERVARVGYNHFISNKGEWNNCFSKFSNRVLPPIFISAILQSVRKGNLAHYFPYGVKLRLLAHSRIFLAKQKARNAIVRAENLLKADKPLGMLVEHSKNS